MGKETCAVVLCGKTIHEGVSLHTIPKSNDANLWLKFIEKCNEKYLELPKYILPKKLHVCSQHFSPECFNHNNLGRKRLLRGHTPHIGTEMKCVRCMTNNGESKQEVFYSNSQAPVECEFEYSTNDFSESLPEGEKDDVIMEKENEIKILETKLLQLRNELRVLRQSKKRLTEFKKRKLAEMETFKSELETFKKMREMCKDATTQTNHSVLSNEDSTLSQDLHHHSILLHCKRSDFEACSNIV